MQSFKMSKSTLCLLLFVLAVFAFACRHEPDLSSIQDVSFFARVQPIVQNNCAKSGCHGIGGEQFPLTTYAEIRERVTPKKPFESDLFKTMTYLDANRVMPPPPDQSLTENQLQIIYTWISQGAKNN